MVKRRKISPRLTIVLALAGSLTAASLTAQQPIMGQMWLTSADRSALLAKQADTLRFESSAAGGKQSNVIDIDDTQNFQSIDGFGFALTGGSAQLLMRMEPAHRRALLKELFLTQKDGIGVSYLRVSIGSSDMNERVFTYDDMPAGSTDTELKKFDLGTDRKDVIPVLREILKIAPGIKILGSPWSAPSWMKTNDDPKGGSLKPEFYPVYAQYFVKYIEAMKAAGIPIDAITVQNEPLNPKNTPSMVMEAPEEGAFIKEALGPAFSKAGIKTKIILYDHNCDRPDYPLSILANSEESQFVDGSGFHLYGGEISAMSKVHDAYPSKNLYFTEQMVVDRPKDTRLHVAEPEERVVVGATRNWSRNVLLWNLAADPHFGPHTDNGGCPVCQGAITLDGNQVTRNSAYYTLAHASKFVRPGSVHIASTTLDGLANVAFKTQTGKIVIIVANSGDAEQKFSLRYHDKLATTTLKGDSVATYVW